MKQIPPETRIIDCTLSDLEGYLIERGIIRPTDHKEPTRPIEYVTGLCGIMELFGVSQSTALRLKDGILKEAITQNGRLILCDKEKAVKLFKSRNRNTTDPK